MAICFIGTGMCSLGHRASAGVNRLIRRVYRVSRTRHRLETVDDIRTLRLLRELEVCRLQVAVTVCQAVTQLLHLILRDKCARCFAFGVNGRRDVAGIFVSFGFHAVDIAVRRAAAVLHLIDSVGSLTAKAVRLLHDCHFGTVILCEVIITQRADTLLNAADAVVELVKVEAIDNILLRRILACRRCTSCISTAVAAEAATPERHNEEQEYYPHAASAVHEPVIAVIVLVNQACNDVAKKTFIHSKHSFHI